MKRALLVVVAVMACMGPQGPAGPVGPAGPTGPRGSDGLQGPPGVPAAGSGALIWKDPSGVIVGTGELLRHQDPVGNWWYLSADTGQVDAHAHEVLAGNVTTYFYETTDCSGPAYLFANSGTTGPIPPPRVPFTYENEGFYRVRNDAGLRRTIAALSSSTASGCVPRSASDMDVFSLQDVPLLGYLPPVLPNGGPLHLERAP